MPTAPTASRAAGLTDLTALDWIAVVLDGLLVLGLVLIPWTVCPAWAAMFDDLGSKQALPGLTKLVLAGSLPLAGAGGGGLGLAVALVGRWTIGWRRVWVVAAFLWSCVALALTWVSMYLPIIALAGAVSA